MESALVVTVVLLRNVETSKFTTGHIKPENHAILGGKMNPSGTERGNLFFPIDNQERVFIDERTGERHIADVYVDKNVVIEFQSYSISAEEMGAREHFYQQMIWVVNGAKRDFDRIYFNQSVYGAHTDDPYLRKIRWVGRSKLLAKWEAATKHVYMDFGTDLVWHLIEYDPKTKNGLVRAYPKQQFVEFFGGTYS